jgi:hypothetical protein
MSCQRPNGKTLRTMCSAAVVSSPRNIGTKNLKNRYPTKAKIAVFEQAGTWMLHYNLGLHTLP